MAVFHACMAAYITVLNVRTALRGRYYVYLLQRLAAIAIKRRYYYYYYFEPTQSWQSEVSTEVSGDLRLTHSTVHNFENEFFQAIRCNDTDNLTPTTTGRKH